MGDRNPFTYKTYDLVTAKYLGQLPLTGFQFASNLLPGSPGTASGVIDIASPAIQALGPLAITAPARTMLVVDYLGVIVWAGIIWPRAYAFENTTRKLTVTASELWSIFQRREQATDYSAPPYSGLTGNSVKMAIWDATLTDAIGVYDPVLIIWQLLSDALHLVSYGNILGGLGVAANGYTTPATYLASGTALPQGDYLAINYPWTSLQALDSVATQLGQNGLGVGFDYQVDCAYAPQPGNPPVATVNLSYPRRGRSYSQNNLVLNCQSAISYSPPEDGSQAANTFYEQGSSGSLVVSQNILPLQQGYPLLEQVASRANITSANILNVLTVLGIADLYVSSFPVCTPSITMDLFTTTLPLGEFVVGDDVRWIIPATDGTGEVFDPRFPGGLDAEWRVTGYSVTVADEGQSTITYNLALPPATLATGPAI